MSDEIDALLEKAAELVNAGQAVEAESIYQETLRIEPTHPGARHNLAALIARRGDPVAALQMLDALVADEPGYASAHFNRGNALHSLHKTEDAIAAYRAVVALDPDHHDAHRALGFLWLTLGNRDRSLDHFARTYDLRRGEGRTGIAARSLRTASAMKLHHDADLFRHLPSRVREVHRFETLARIYEGLAEEFSDEVVELTSSQLNKLGADYNTCIHLIDAPEIMSGAVNAAANWGWIEEELSDNRQGVAWLDGLLTDRALALLQRYLAESTIWHDFSHIPGFVSSYLEDGLACPLVLQIADEVRGALPGLLADKPLTQAWAFKALKGDKPIALHADDGTFSLNFWITPDAANRNPDTGGLTVYRETPPADWELVDYNADQERIQVFVDQHGDSRVTIPYRQNRGVIFTSRLFHGTDQPDFDTGYANHRINITMLFGDASKL